MRLNSLLDVPEFVKNSSVPEEGLPGLSPHQFADPVKREFPIHTAGHTYLSFAYCKSAGVNGEILSKVKMAAQKFGIAAELAKVETAFEGAEKQASAPQAKYAVYMDFGPAKPESENVLEKRGGVAAFYPINTEEQVKSAALKLAMQREKIPLELFVDGCRNVVKQAKVLKIARAMLPRIVDDYGTERIPQFDFLVQQAASRGKLTGDGVYMDIVKSAAANDEHHSMDEYLELWKQADDQNGVTYTKSVWDPYRIFNSGITVEANEEDLEKYALVGNAAIPVEVLAKVSDEKIAKFFTKELGVKMKDLVKQAAANTGSVVTDWIRDTFSAGEQRALLKILTN